MSVTLQDLASQQLSQLYAIIKNEIVPGKRLNNIAWSCESTGHSGHVTLADVRKSTSLWTGLMPGAGVRIANIARAPYSTTRQQMTVTFNVLVATQDRTPTVVGSIETQANLDDCIAQLQALVSDGTGNGVAAILTDPANFTLNNTCNELVLSNIQYADDDGQSEDPDINAYAWFTVTTKKLVSIV